MRALILVGSFLFGGSAWADVADWKITSQDLALSADYENLKTYLDSYKVPAQDFLIAPAGYREPALSGLAPAFRRIAAPGIQNYTAATFAQQTSDVWIDTSLILAANIYFGTSMDGWGSTKFHFEDEGWFGKDTYALGMDKLGHAFGAYLYSDYLTQRIAHSESDPGGAAVTGALLGFGLQAVVEVIDGYSTDYGFSNQDLIADGVGAGFSILRNSVPGLASKVDFRMEYNPWATGSQEFSPFNDYSSQKYLLALKLAGFEKFEDTPLRFVELQAGYFARGFGDKGQPAIGELRREPYFAIGLNLSELLNQEPIRHTAPVAIAQRVLEVIQVPYTYAATVNK